MKSKYTIMRPGKSPRIPMRGIPSDTEDDFVIKINSAWFDEGFKYVTTWEILAWKKPIFIGECDEE